MSQTTITVDETAKDLLESGKPDGVTWTDYLLTLADEADNPGEAIAEQLDVPDTDEFARDVARHIDYAQIAGQVAGEIEERMR